MRATVLLSLLVLAFACGCGGGDSGTPDAGRDTGGADTAPPGDAAVPEGAVRTDEGPVVGVDDGDLRIFRGIPYAAPPVGDLRFRPPAPHPGWTDPLSATAFGPECPQRGDGTSVVGDEDCLTLNVWAHADDRVRPVMVWIHGGGYVQGAGSLPVYEGSALARGGDVVVVTLNYRLGALGFLAMEQLAAEDEASVAGNYGTRDQIAALDWVRRNIASFGGDPEQVTIFGESAGGSSVCILLGSPLAEGLFARGIIESGGGCFGYPSLRTPGLQGAAVTRGAQVASAAGCEGADVPACLRALPASALVDATYGGGGASFLGLPDIGPNVDGVVVPDQPYQRFARGTARDVPVIVGSNADEMATFLVAVPVADEARYEALVRAYVPIPATADALLALYPASAYASPKAAYVAMTSDIAFICPALAFAEVSAGGAEPSYAYHFTHALASGAAAALGAFHGLEIPFVFGNTGSPLYTPTATDEAVSARMLGAWSAFARGEGPVVEPTWPAFDPASPGIAIFGGEQSVAPEIREGHCEDLRALGLSF